VKKGARKKEDRMGPRLITMLTNNDETVQDSFERFDECASLPCEFWGFKDVGLPKDRMKGLVQRMKDRGKTTFLEVVTLSEAECLDGAKLAVDCGFHYLMGTVFHESVFRFMKGKPTKFFPFAGTVSGHPSILSGAIPDIVADGNRMEKLGVDGFDLLAYRYTADAVALSAAFIKGVKVPVVMAGSVDGYKRLDEVKTLSPWAFTIGSAFFARMFKPGGTFRDQVAAVLDYMGR
jgi:hypothetical protein